MSRPEGAEGRKRLSLDGQPNREKPCRCLGMQGSPPRSCRRLRFIAAVAGRARQKAMDKLPSRRYSRRMTDEPRDLAVENALLRSLLGQTAKRLKDYHDAPHFEIEGDGGSMMEVIVPPSLRPKATETLAKAQTMLKNKGRGWG